MCNKTTLTYLTVVAASKENMGIFGVVFNAHQWRNWL